ncbi:MAG: hypothetical protein PHQ43_05705 [Dehalococcoidales bacterium]|nr:hypothetical protein [Dehalococcoidales bacterium]
MKKAIIIFLLLLIFAAGCDNSPAVIAEGDIIDRYCEPARKVIQPDSNGINMLIHDDIDYVLVIMDDSGSKTLYYTTPEYYETCAIGMRLIIYGDTPATTDDPDEMREATPEEIARFG